MNVAIPPAEPGFRSAAECLRALSELRERRAQLRRTRAVITADTGTSAASTPPEFPLGSTPAREPGPREDTATRRGARDRALDSRSTLSTSPSHGPRKPPAWAAPAEPLPSRNAGGGGSTPHI